MHGASLGYTVLILVIYALAVARLTRLINFDAILDRPRSRIARRWSDSPAVVYFLTCPWCVSMWVSFGTAWIPLYHYDNRWVLYVLLGLATSHVIGILAPLAHDDEVEIEDVSEEEDF